MRNGEKWKQEKKKTWGEGMRGWGRKGKRIIRR